MLTLSLDSAFRGLAATEVDPEGFAFRRSLVLQADSFIPVIWLCFSLTFSRGNYREFLSRSRFLIAGLSLLPVIVLVSVNARFLALPLPDFDWMKPAQMVRGFTACFLLATVLILMNLERTFRSAVGTMQWRVKFVVLGLAVIFGARFYALSQALIYSGAPLPDSGMESGSILIGCAFITVGYFRGGFGAIDIYPSRAALQASLTVILAGAYLLIVGVLAQIVAHSGRAEGFQFQALLILLGVTFLAVLLLSKRIRRAMELFVSRHFKRPEHDFRQIWSRFTNATSRVLDAPTAAATAAKLISETFDALSVTVWLLDQGEHRLTFAASTNRAIADSSGMDQRIELTEEMRSDLRSLRQPVDLEKAKGDWAEALRSENRSHFGQGGDRVLVPLRASDAILGIIVLADRVNAVRYTPEEFDLLECIGDQIAANLLNLRLAHNLLMGKELSAFQTISTFFVHDLKNAASTLGLMLQNLPIHFDDPAFREDALRGIARTADRINQLISSLSVVRERLPLNPVDVDLNQIVDEALGRLNGALGREVVKDLQKVPRLVGDREQLQNVVTNLVLNARDAMEQDGTVTVKTGRRDEWATLSVSDTGCGMNPAFIRDSLFRPFSTTKKKGLGIGMFQSKMIIEAHGGNIQVTSDVGKGTTFSVFLPLKQTTE
jgi:putative PEP-CTERM system histidine kinase